MGPGRIILFIMLGMLAWGLYHAVGAYQLNHSLLRFAVVMACMLGFLAFWGVMLFARRARLRRRGHPASPRPSHLESGDTR